MCERSGELKIEHARLNNLKDVSVTIPKGVLTAVSGVARSGKSSLILGCLPQAYPETIIIDQNLARGFASVQHRDLYSQSSKPTTALGSSAS